MIDIHTHVLPGIDDGAERVEESLKLLSALEKQGVDKVVLTPHYYGRTRNVDKFLAERKKALETLRAAYKGNIEFVTGCECNISTCANGNMGDLLPLAIGNTPYILVEMSFEPKWENELWERLFELIYRTELTPVIAHIELYPAVMKHPEYARRLIEENCLLQMNCDSVIKAETGSLSYALLKHGQIHCLGSDTHNTYDRPPHYAQAAESIEKIFGKEYADILQIDMKKILSGEKVKVVPTDSIVKRCFKYV